MLPNVVLKVILSTDVKVDVDKNLQMDMSLLIVIICSNGSARRLPNWVLALKLGGQIMVLVED